MDLMMKWLFYTVLVVEVLGFAGEIRTKRLLHKGFGLTLFEKR